MTSLETTDAQRAGRLSSLALLLGGLVWFCMSMKTDAWMWTGLALGVAAFVLLVYAAVLVRRARRARSKPYGPGDV